MDLAFERLMPSMIQQLPSCRKGKIEVYRSSYVQPLRDQGAGSSERVLSGSIRERLYYYCENGVIVDAGILLYTSPSSDGTLGGLVQQGATVERLRH